MVSHLGFFPNFSIPLWFPITINSNLGQAELWKPIDDNRVSLEEKLVIIINRLAQKYNPSVNANPSSSVVFGQPDFLPFPFLSLGIKRGASVCRILRNFSTEDSAKSFISTIHKAVMDLSIELSPEFLAEILCISPTDANSLFFIDNGTNRIANLEPCTFLEKLPMIPIASGFLVGRDMLLTNLHVFPVEALNIDKFDVEFSGMEEIEKSYRLCEFMSEHLHVNDYVAEFGYEQDLLGRDLESVRYRFEKVLIVNLDLDFVLVRLTQNPEDTKFDSINYAGDQFGWIPLMENDRLIAPPFPGSNNEISRNKKMKEFDDEALDDEALDDEALKVIISKVIGELPENIRQSLRGLHEKSTPGEYLSFLQSRASSGDPVNIIQHPKGRHKELVLSNNRLIDISENFITYEADTDFSSSGSPVMNQQWQLVGLHRGVLYKQEKAQVSGELGVRTSQIVQFILHYLIDQIERLSRNEVAPQYKSDVGEIWFFVKRFVQLEKSTKIPPLPGLEDYSISIKETLQSAF
jgi:hypothetical protein